jgi:hypothetical protein
VTLQHPRRALFVQESTFVFFEGKTHGKVVQRSNVGCLKSMMPYLGKDNGGQHDVCRHVAKNAFLGCFASRCVRFTWQGTGLKFQNARVATSDP